jgi:nucleoside-diphosphate-sugar epimerase
MQKGKAMSRKLFILGGTGFIGHETIIQALKAEWQVKALARSEEGAKKMRQMGAQPVIGDMYQAQAWIAETQGATALIDLTQPKLPQRVSRSAMKSLSTQRQAMTRSVLDALKRLSAQERPIFFSISSADDLEPDAHGVISERSHMSTELHGFGYIGVPVRKLVETSGLDATYVYLGSLVYGPGKLFAEVFVTGLKKGSAHVVGKGTNRPLLIHVTDAARAIVHLTGLPREAIVDHQFMAMDGAGTTQRALLNDTAMYMGVKKPPTIPAWVAALIVGPTLVETILLDAQADNSSLQETGFHFLYPSPREGVPATLAELGYAPANVQLA